jgi:hypothetical protein
MKHRTATTDRERHRGEMLHGAEESRAYSALLGVMPRATPMP